jgi:hypothetical protein
MTTKKTAQGTAKAPKTKLQEYLGGSVRSTSREYLLTTRLIHDVCVAAGVRGYDLRVYTPTVDADGFDVIFDDGDRLVPVQLKSVVAGGKAKQWGIRRSLLRPEPDEADLFGFEPSPSGTGRGGGVVRITAEAIDDEVSVTYSYTDIAVLSLLWGGILSRPESHVKRLAQLRNELESKPSGEVALPRSAFLRAPSPSALLALAGLHSRIDTAWRDQLRMVLRQENLNIAAPAPLDYLRAAIAKDLNVVLGAKPELGEDDD